MKLNPWMLPMTFVYLWIQHLSWKKRWLKKPGWDGLENTPTCWIVMPDHGFSSEKSTPVCPYPLMKPSLPIAVIAQPVLIFVRHRPSLPPINWMHAVVFRI